jgi:thiol-disulfide isomerase/thioredoxin
MKRVLLLALLWAGCLPALAFGLQPVASRRAPPLSVPLATGGGVNLAYLRGRVVVVNFWASWCPPCLMEMPSMDHLARVMGRYPFVLLAVNAGESAASVQGFVRRTRPRFPVGLDEGSRYMHAWGALMVPASFLVDKAGRVRYSLFGPVQWDSPEMIGVITGLMRE